MTELMFLVVLTVHQGLTTSFPGLHSLSFDEA